jgi:hypothetical protein
MTGDLVPAQLRIAGTILRHHRETVRWSLEEAAAALECDKSKISRMETGHRRVVPDEMLKLLAAYGVTDRERQAVAALVGASHAGWWGEYRGLLPDAMVDQAMLESIAGDVMVYEPQALPAFLQTHPYAAAVAAADPALETDEERRLAVQLSARRARGARGKAHAAFTVVLGEAALRQRVGGDEAMLGQLSRIVEDAGELSGRVTFQVIPFSADTHPAIGTGPLSIMRFPGVTGVGAICQGWTASGVSIARQAELTAAIRRFEALRAAALSPEQSIQLIGKVTGTRQ